MLTELGVIGNRCRVRHLLMVSVLLAIGCRPTPVVNVAPSGLDAKISVIDTDPNSGDNKVIIAVQFFSGNQFVQLASGTSVNANGTLLPWNGLAYMDRVLTTAPGATYTVVHTQRGTSTTIATITVPQRPVINSPSAGAAVPRSSGVMITYVPAGGTHVNGQASGQKAGSGSVSVGGNEQPDDGSYGPIDSTGFDPGGGSVSLTRVLVTSPSGSGFNSVQVTYNVGNRVRVTWQ